MLAASLAGDASAAPRTHTVAIVRMKFGPVPPNIRVGDTIIWVNKDIFRHTATARDRSFNVDLPPGASRRMAVKRSGATPFYCLFHPGMKAQLVAAK